MIAIVGSLIGGLVMILPDIFFFGQHSQVIMDSYVSKPTIPYLLASVTYGAVIEEVMLRLFTMSLIAFLLHKLFWRKSGDTPLAALIIANILSALLFAAGHLPATFALLVANFLSASASQQVGDVLYAVLIIVSAPMVCSQFWVLSLFLWSILFFAAKACKKKL